MELKGAEQTIQIGRWIGERLPKGTVVVLEGDLGAGKTTFSKGIAEGLGITQMIKSPTYTIIREYEEGKYPLYHMDVYRVGDSAEDLGLEEYFESDGISLVEWGSMIEELLPKNRLEIILYHQDETTRQMKIKGYGDKKALADEWNMQLK